MQRGKRAERGGDREPPRAPSRRGRPPAHQRHHNRLYQEYVRHLPEVPLDASLLRGRIGHRVFHHDDWCRFYETENPADCNCDVVVTRHVEPVRS
jgi:hypothetical protein